MAGNFFARAFKSSASDDRFVPEMKAPSGLLHEKTGRHRGSYRFDSHARKDRTSSRKAFTKIHHMAGIRFRTKNQAPEHARYLMRTHRTGLQSEREAFFDAAGDGVDGVRFASRIQHDDQHFRFIVSPQDGDKLEAAPGGMRGYVRELMREVEKDLKTRLEWVAVIHAKGDRYNPNNRHVHIIVRGVTEPLNRGRRDTLRLHGDFRTGGFTGLAEEVATRILGPRSREEREAYRAWKMEREKEREREERSARRGVRQREAEVAL